MHTDPRSHGRHRALQETMADSRSGQVVYVSHCLLNQNTRYLGGAVCPGVVVAAIEPYLKEGTGIVQMPCPEQRVWGGVLKSRMLWLILHPRVARATPILSPLVLRYVRRQYAHHARAVARDIDDYRASGLRIRGIVGVAGSPSCGVHTTLDLKRAAQAMACRRNETVTAAWMNTTVVRPALCPGRGMFVEELTRALRRRDLDVSMREEQLASGSEGGQDDRIAAE
jgi:uncharacterized protein YbbK (DUF523 family)